MSDTTAVHPEDVVPVRSRVSWSAIFAGAALAFTVSLVLSLLGTAIGLSIHNQVEQESLGIGAALWAVVSIIVSLFIGGYVTSQCTAGESRTEAVIHGVIMWGVLSVAVVWLAASTLSGGFSALVGLAHVTTRAGNRLANEGWETAARRAGVPQAEIDRWHDELTRQPGAARTAPATPERFAHTATQAAWWSLLGVVLSMLAAIGGALTGAGPNPSLVAILTRARLVGEQNTARLP